MCGGSRKAQYLIRIKHAAADMHSSSRLCYDCTSVALIQSQGYQMNTVRSPETDDFHSPLVQTSTLYTEMRKKYCKFRQLHKSTLGISSDASHPSLLKGAIHPAELTWWLLPQTHRLHP